MAELGWWIQVAFEGWRDRSGPYHQRLAATMIDRIETRTIRVGARVPAERALAQGLGVSRGTVVSCLDQLAVAGVVRRRQGAGTFIVGTPGWARSPGDRPAATQLYLRRLAADRDTIDLSWSVPGGIDHLPPVDGHPLVAMSGHGLTPMGDRTLQQRVADHLTAYQGLPTDADQIFITSGAQQALTLIARTTQESVTGVLATCPTYPGLKGAFAGSGQPLIPVGDDGAGGFGAADLRRAGRGTGRPIVYVAPTGSNPTGHILNEHQRRQLLATVPSRALLVEDLTLADLALATEAPPPLAAMEPSVIVIGSASKLFWAGLRVGWIRIPPEIPPDLHADLVKAKAALDLATSAVAQNVVASLLAAIDDRWIGRLRAVLLSRRDHLADLIATQLPAWRVAHRAEAGLSIWIELPIADADAFVHLAQRHGVLVAAGSTMCWCGRHRNHIRVSYAETTDALDLAVDRLAVAWQAHSEDLATLPSAARAR